MPITRLIAGAAASLLATGSLLLLSAPVQAAACVNGADSDFNGDGVTDIAIADPEATVDSQAKAGRVHVVYGSSWGSETVSASGSLIPSAVGPNYQLGAALASFDFNADGCDDLAVGAPNEPVSGQAEAGAVYILYGSTNGLSSTSPFVYSQASFSGATPEAGDHFGASLAAGTTSSGQPFLFVGVPGEDIGTVADAGAVYYLRGGVTYGWSQDTTGIPGTAEAGDRYGFSLAADSLHVAVSMPYEDVGTESDTGAVQVFSHTVSGSTLTLRADWDQEGTGQSGEAEAGDYFGFALSMVTYKPTTSTTETLLAIGVPGEWLNDNTEDDAGRVVALVTITASGTASEYVDLHQGLDGVEGETETGDAFGTSVQLINRTPGAVPTWQNLILLVGVSGEDTDSGTNVGGVQMFSMVGNPGDHDAWVDLSTYGYTPKAGARFGRYLSGNSTYAYFPDPTGNMVAVYAIPWANIVSGGSLQAQILKPGTYGLPATGYGLFGTVVK